ncbi:xaa-Pro aminopeptidase 1 [Pyricularia oryzae 70-15]|nr:xaa-Pro aminopeptidase 1 [Pyricularia oryzae 70-15]EHA49003.1 xaa-Pro aminopeptidase 1 [Pyricularia oryzae 70-15]KAI7926579.1 xaa-Pro aminopeptidase 1 [Pyricularia oryzae]KAI7929419.1 xaa-Pro aminopeptidase 1 [Pyricularia oryzae]
MNSTSFRQLLTSARSSSYSFIQSCTTPRFVILQQHQRPSRAVVSAPSSCRQFVRCSSSSPESPFIMKTVSTSDRLAELRGLMRARSIDVYIVPTEDAHSSEYIAPCDGRREFISGFSGSAGTAVVTNDKAALATDGRYFNQAATELDNNWELLKQGQPDVPTWQEWTADQAAGGKTVGVDPTLLSSSEAKALQEKIKSKGGNDLVAISDNLVDLVWGRHKPSRPSNPIAFLPKKYSGKDTEPKLKELREVLEKKKVFGFVISTLDEIAWLFNLRGSDIPYNPVFFSYAVVTADNATLYVDASKLSEESHAYLKENKVDIRPYESIFEDSEVLAKSLKPTEDQGEESKVKKLAISNKTSWALKLALGGDGAVDEIKSPVCDAKAIKNETELEGMRQCHIRDGAALIEYFAWLEDQVANKKATLNEVQAATKLENLRAKHEDFVGLSFTTISAVGANAAVIHYKPEEDSCATIDADSVYLCDSGAQFLDGTTDTTRTLHFGKPSEAERKAYTLVLKGNMALDMAIFPKGTTGFALDPFARQFLWQEGLDYRHGTGHGVGSYLNVHEGPIGIGTRKHYAGVPLAPGNVTSIEPGFYEDGSYGIRIENIAMIREVETKHMFGDKPYLGFEHVTMVPYCRRLIDESLLTPREKQWLNDYNKLILDKTSGFFKDDNLTMAWLERETQPY